MGSSVSDVSVDLDVLRDCGRVVLSAATTVAGITELGDVSDDALACADAVAALRMTQLEMHVRAETSAESLRSAGNRPGAAANAVSALDSGMVTAV